MLKDGQFASMRELAKAERVSLAYISRILRLTLLAPDIVERILNGRTVGLAALLKAVPGRLGAAAARSPGEDGQPLTAPAVSPCTR